MNWSEISRILTGCSDTENDSVIEELSLDSRLITKPEETLFFAIDGIQHDGHDFVEELAERGVRHFIIERDVEISEHCNFLRVENAISALQKLVAYHRSQFEIPVIGITGSNGKTTTKEWLAQVLSPSYKLIKKVCCMTCISPI
jgi:alanine racemase